MTLELPWDEDEDGPKRGWKWVMQFEWARTPVGGGGCWQAVEEEEATSSGSSSDHLRPLLSSHSHQPTSYPHAVLYYTSILLHHPDPIIPTTPPPPLCCQPATAAASCKHQRPPLPARISSPTTASQPTDRQCAHRIPDLSAAAQASFPLPHSIPRPPSAATQSSARLASLLAASKSGLIHVPRRSTPPSSPLLRRHRPSSHHRSPACSCSVVSCSQRRPLHSRPLPACVPCIIRLAKPSQTPRALLLHCRRTAACTLRGSCLSRARRSAPPSPPQPPCPR